MSRLAAVWAAAPIAGQPGAMQVFPAVHSTHATNSAAHSVIAVRANSAGALTVGKNRKAPKFSQSVKTTARSTRLMFPPNRPDHYFEMRRLTLLLAAAAALITAPPAHAATRAGWNSGEQEDVAQAGVLTRLADGR